MAQSIRLGIAGGHRGKGFGLSLRRLKGRLDLTAICDIDNGVRESWKAEFPKIKTFGDYGEMLRSGTVDAVLIATPMPLHVSQAVQALKRGIHVASEVTACISIAEGRELIRAVEASSAVYFFAENYCYQRVHMMVEHMVRRNVFGDITYVSGSYYHDCRHLMFDREGGLTWRGKLRRDYNCHTYPTHSLGPIDRWLGIREGRDSFVSVSAMSSREAALSAYARRRFRRESSYAGAGYFKHGDTQKVLIKTRNGVLVDLLFDPVSPRVGNCAEHFITGTKACFHSNTVVPHGSRACSGPAISFAKSPDHKYSWEPLMKHAQRYEHPLWRRHLPFARSAGHGGGDYFVLQDFLRAIETEETPAIDVYDAVLWSSFIELSERAICTGREQAVPCFRPVRACS